jgi:hypothetical protein
MLLRSASAVCALAYFCCCNGNARLAVAAVVTAVFRQCKGSSPGFVRSIEEIAASPLVLAFRDCTDGRGLTAPKLFRSDRARNPR